MLLAWLALFYPAMALRDSVPLRVVGRRLLLCGGSALALSPRRADAVDCSIVAAGARAPPEPPLPCHCRYQLRDPLDLFVGRERLQFYRELSSKATCVNR